MHPTLNPFTPKHLMLRTLRTRQRYDDQMRALLDASRDARWKERTEKGLCRACFYLPAPADWRGPGHRCMACDGETAPDAVLCVECSDNNCLCCHCGGDIDMNTRRADWPGC